MVDPMSSSDAPGMGGGPFTARAFLFAVTSSLAWILAQSFVGPLSGFFVTGEGALSMVFLAAILFRGRLRPSEYAMIFGMVEAASIAAIEIGAMSAAPLAINLLTDLRPLLQVTPDFFRLSSTDVAAAAEGGSPIPPGLAPIIMAMLIINSVFFLLILVATAMFRRTMVEVERLPFPVARACYTVTQLFNPTTTFEHRLRRRVFLEGVVIGLLLTFVTEGYLVSQELPFINLIPYSMNDPIYQALKPILPGALMGFSWAGAVWTMWFLYLAPAESTITAAASNFIAYMIVAPIMVAFNVVRWDPSLSYDEYLYELIGRGAISYSWLGAGLLLAAAVVPPLMDLRHGLKERISLEALRSYHLLLSLACLSSLTLLGAYLFGSPPILSALLLAAILLGYNLWLTRSLSELNTTQSDQGLFMGCMWALGSSLSGFRLGEFSGAAYGAIAISYLFSGNATVGAGCMEAYRLADMANMRWRDMTMVLLCSLLITSLVGPLLYLSVLYATGLPTFSGDPKAILWSQAASSLGSDAALAYIIRGESPYRLNLPAGIAGFLMGLAAILIRTRCAFLPISVVAAGVGVATDPGNGFLVFLIPGLARILTLKIGGIRLYEGFGVPLFTGISCGAVLGALSSSLNILRYTLFIG